MVATRPKNELIASTKPPTFVRPSPCPLRQHRRSEQEHPQVAREGDDVGRDQVLGVANQFNQVVDPRADHRQLLGGEHLAEVLERQADRRQFAGSAEELLEEAMSGWGFSQTSPTVSPNTPKNTTKTTP